MENHGECRLPELQAIIPPRGFRPRIQPLWILHPLAEVLFLVVCGTIADCDDYDDIAA